MDRTERYRQAEQRLFDDARISPEERWLRLPTLELDVRVLEAGEGVPALFLHGGPNAAATWAYLVSATSGVRCILLDRPGTGLSPRPPHVPGLRDLPRCVEQLTLDVLNALGLDRLSLVGSSFGGYSALRSAAVFPDRVDRVVLAGCPAFVPRWTAPGFFTLLRAPLLGSLLLAAPPTAASVRMSLRQLGHRRSLSEQRIPTPMLEWIRAWQRDTRTMQNDAAMIRRCGIWRGGFDPALDLDDAALGSVRAPTLIQVGTDDPVGGPEVARNLASLLPAATVEIWEGAGHLPWLDDPVRAAASLSAFLTAPA